MGWKCWVGRRPKGFSPGCHLQVLTFQVQANAVGIGVSDDKTVIVDVEHIPLTVHALLAVVVGECGLESLGAVPADAFSTKNLVYSAGEDFGGMEATTPRAICSASAEVRPDSGRGISAIALRIASSTCAAVNPASGSEMAATAAWTICSNSFRDRPGFGCGTSAIASRTVSSTSAAVSEVSG